MKVLLRHRYIELYYAGSQRWVGDPAQAVDFQEIERASRKKREQAMPETEVVFRDLDPFSACASEPRQCFI